jgi:hypothetical protein
LKKTSFLPITVLLMYCSAAVAQIPVEVFGGTKKTTFDIMFFKFLKSKQGQNSQWLFFNRNRASIDYKMTSTTNLPAFGFTEAISYNYKKLKGFAPVVVVQVSTRTISPKAGIQFFHRKKDFTFFSWVVIETLQNPHLDFFLLTRYEPALRKQVKLFTQVELVSAFPTVSSSNYNLFQRVRLGVRKKDWQAGVGADFTEFGNTTLLTTNNLGVFLRYEF